MPSPRWLPPALIFLLAGCNHSPLQQRAEQIREYSDNEDRAYAAEALHHIERNYWTLRNHTWLGKLEDGTIVELDAPHATAAPLPSSAFYSGWHLQLTISSADWRTYPASSHEEPFEAVYAITRHSATSWSIELTSGSATTPLHREDAALLTVATGR